MVVEGAEALFELACGFVETALEWWTDDGRPPSDEGQFRYPTSLYEQRPPQDLS